MAYDEALAERLRELVADEATGGSVTEMRMFGGLAFLVGGNMSVAASGQGGLMVRVDPQRADELLAEPGVSVMEMRGRVAAGWLRVALGADADESDLRRWVRRGVDYAAGLPPKPGR